MDYIEINNDQEEQNKKKKRKKNNEGTAIFLIGLAVGIALSLIVLLVASGGKLFVLTNGDSVVTSKTIQKINGLTSLIDESYYKADEVTEEQLQDGLYKGLVEALDDPYSVYYTKDEIEELEESISGTFSGIGAYVSADETTGYPMIVSVIEGSPAEEAGLLSGDILYEVDGESLQGVDLDVAVSKIKGEEGTSVHLTIVRSGEADYLEFDIVRAQVDSETVYGEMLEDDIGYIQITEFDDVSCDQFVPILEELIEEGMEGLILDLRDNPGGTVDSVTDIAEYLVPEGLVFYMEYPDGTREEYEVDGEQAVDVPIVVLINGNSASASEILSSAIQDSGAGILVGTTTYGKGVVQTIYSLSGDSGAVKLTTAQYYTRNGHDINEVGIEPDVEVELDAEAYLEDGTDTQLEEAINEIKKRME